MADHAHAEDYQIDVTPELLVIAQRARRPAGDQLQVEGFRRSWFAWLSELLIGRDRNAAPQRGN